MTTPPAFLNTFGPRPLGPGVRRALGHLKRLEAFEDLYALFAHLFSAELWARADGGPVRRERVFTPQVTFWAFVFQVLSPASSCREVARRVQVWWKRTTPATFALSPSSSAYCQARARLDLGTLGLIAQHVAWSVERHVLGSERGLGGRTVKRVDGTTLSMPDTPANQARWPQPSGQKPGCGFPMMKLGGLFSLGSGALLESVTDNQHHSESVLFRALWDKLRPGEVALADRAFCSSATLAGLLSRGVDSLMRLHQARPVDFRRGKALGRDDRLVTWQKPDRRPDGCPEEAFAALPETLPVRLIRLRVTAKGFRPRPVVLATTLLDAERYPAAGLRELDGERWQVELHFQQIQTSLAMDVLRCKSPALILREVALHGIAYNLVRSLMQQSAHRHRVPLERLSFKGTLDTVRSWAAPIDAAGGDVRQQQAFDRRTAPAHRRGLGARAAGPLRAARPQTARQNPRVTHPPTPSTGPHGAAPHNLVTTPNPLTLVPLE